MKQMVLALALVGCGYSAKENEMVGQVKKVVEQTPLICGDYTEADVSLGVLRDGNGSMSKEDVILRVNGSEDKKLLKDAAESGRPVKITYDIKRFVWCGPDHILTSVSYLPQTKRVDSHTLETKDFPEVY